MSLLTQFYSGGGSSSTNVSGGNFGYAALPGAPTSIVGSNIFSITSTGLPADNGFQRTGNYFAYTPNLGALAWTTGGFYVSEPFTNATTSITVNGLSANALADITLVNYYGGDSISSGNSHTLNTNFVTTMTGGFFVGRAAGITGDSSLISISNAVFTTVGYSAIGSAVVSIVGPNLVDISTCSFYPVFAPPTNFTPSFACTNAKLSAASVNRVLTQYYNNLELATPSFAAGNINMSGGTSAGLSQLSAEGLAARNGLVSGGWTVTLNA